MYNMHALFVKEEFVEDTTFSVLTSLWKRPFVGEHKTAGFSSAHTIVFLSVYRAH